MAIRFELRAIFNDSDCGFSRGLGVVTNCMRISYKIAAPWKKDYIEILSPEFLNQPSFDIELTATGVRYNIHSNYFWCMGFEIL